MNQITARRRARLAAGFVPQVTMASKPAPLDIADIRHFVVREPVSKNQYSLLRVALAGQD
jgi:hypothetical protein